MKQRFEVTYRVKGQQTRRVVVTVENAGQRDVLRILKEKILRGTRKVGFRVFRIERLK